MDIRSVDWEDRALCKAYEKAMGGGVINKKVNVNSSPPKERMKHKWKVGDYCRAIYSEDSLYYEAKIIDFNGNVCTVEFLGYGDTQDVDPLKLKKTKGKKARKQQIKASKDYSSDVNSSIGESGNTTDGSVAKCSSYHKKKRRTKKAANDETLDTTVYEATIHQQYSAPPALPQAPQSSMPESGNATDGSVAKCSSYHKKKRRTKKAANDETLDTTVYEATIHQQYSDPPALPQAPQSSMPMSLPPQASTPQNSVPPPPPMMPQNSSLANNPEIASILIAWYMAGYYTGKFEARVQNNGGNISRNHSS